MKIALHDAGGKEYLQFMRQLGVEYVVSAVGPGASGALEVDDIVRKKEYFAEHGVIWDVIENLDPRIYYKVMAGEEGREEQMDRVCESIRAVGEAGIGVLQYQWICWVACAPNTARRAGAARGCRASIWRWPQGCRRRRWTGSVAASIRRCPTAS